MLVMFVILVSLVIIIITPSTHPTLASPSSSRASWPRTQATLTSRHSRERDNMMWGAWWPDNIWRAPARPGKLYTMRECDELVQVGDSEYSGLAQNTSRSLIICDMCNMCDMCHPDNSACLIICYSLESTGLNCLNFCIASTNQTTSYLITFNTLHEGNSF